MAYTKPWHRRDRAQAAAELSILARSAYEINADRISAALECASLFEGCTVTVPSSGGYSRTARTLPGSSTPHIRRKAHSIVMGNYSLMFCQDNPIGMFTNNGGGWAEHNQSVLLNQAIAEEYKAEQGQGRFATTHALHRKGGLLGLAATGGYMAFTWPGWEKPEVELEDTLSVVLDSGGPQSPTLGLVRTGYYDPDYLYECQEIMFGGKGVPRSVIEENTIDVTDITWHKRSAFSSSMERNRCRRQVVAVRQGWRNKIGNTDGRMMGVLDRGQVLYDREYTRRELAPAWWRFEPELFGDWSWPLTQLIFYLCARINEITHDTDTTLRKSPHRLIAATKQQIDQFGSVRGVQFLAVDHKARDPRIIHAEMYNKDAIAMLDRYEQWADQDGQTERNHSTGGSGQMAKSGKHEHLRASYWTELHADPTEAAVQCIAVEQSRRFVWALQDMVEAGVEITRFWGPEGAAREEIKVNDLNLDESRFAKSVHAVSDKSNDPASKQAELKEWFEMGKIDAASYVQRSRDLDTQSVADGIVMQQKWVDEQIRQWMHASKERLLEPDFYQSPRPGMDMDMLADRVRTALLEAELQGMHRTEPERLEFFELFLDECLHYAELEKAQATANVSAEAPMASLFPALMGGSQPGVATSGNQQPAIGAVPAPGQAGASGATPGQLSAQYGGQGRPEGGRLPA